MLLSQGDDYGARKSGQLDHVFDLVLLLRPVHAVSQHQPALRISVADLDCDALPGLDYVQRPVGVRTDEVLHQTQRGCEIGLETQLGDTFDRGQDRSGTVLVHVHLLDAGCGLEVESA